MAQTKIKAGLFEGIIGNGADGYFLMSNGDGTMTWTAIVINPTIASIAYPGSATAADPAGGETITVTGTDFKTGATVTIGGTAAPAVSYVSATQITFTTPAKAAGDYDIVVTNTDTGSATYINGISYNGIPTWTTAAGSLGTFASEATISTITLQATEPDAGTITFNITNGALPTGLSLTGANIDGTTTLETADTLYTFTVTATDDESQATPRTFTITVTKQFISTENFTINTYTGNGSTQSIEGKIGTASSFALSNSYIIAGSGLYESARGTNGTSVSFWMQSRANNYVTPIYTRTSSAAAGWHIRTSTGGNGINWGWQNSSGGVVFASGEETVTLTDGWHHIVAIWDGTTNANGAKLYIDGSLFGELTANATLASQTFSLEPTLGNDRQSGGRGLKGLDQVRFFNKALSSSEVTTLYGENNTSTTKSTTDIFDDGSGVALYEFEEGAKDTGGVTGYIGDGGIFENPTGNKIGHSISLGANFSISFWINVSSYSNTYYQSTTGDIIGFGGDNANGIWISTYSGKFSLLRGSISGGQAISTNTNIPVNTWAHVAVSYSNGNTTSFYVNGAAAGTYNHTTTTTSTGVGIFSYIGDSDYPNKSIKSSFTGKIDQVRIFNKAISSSEVTTLYGETSASATKSTTDVFDDGSGIALYELEGNANDRGRFGRGTIDSGQSGVFNGSNSYMTIGNPIGSNIYSFSIWIKPTTTSPSGIGTIIGGGGTALTYYQHTNGSLLVYNGGTYLEATNFFQDTNWVHLVAVSNGSNILIYRNGALFATLGASIALNSITFGRFQLYGIEYFNGSLDQIRIYDSALSASDVEALVSETNVPTTNLVAHYKLDGNANDETGSYNGTFSYPAYSSPAEFPTYDGTATNVSYAYDGTPTNVSFVGTSFQPDFVWIKDRSGTNSHNINDSARGTLQTMQSNTTSSTQFAPNGGVSSFDSNGFTLGSGGFFYSDVSASGTNYVAWCWKAGGAAVSNTDGTITSQVSANVDAGFSIVKYTANATSGATIGHGLDQELDLLIVKSTNLGQAWNVYVKDVTDTSSKYLRLNEASSIADLITVSPRFIPNNFTNSVFSVGNDNSTNGISTADFYIAYCFHSVDGYQKVGSYTGTGVSGNTVTTGFQPRFVMIKSSSNAEPWFILDAARDATNPRDNRLMADSSAAEDDGSVHTVDFTPDGFTANGTVGNGTNGSGVTYIYLAIK